MDPSLYISIAIGAIVALGEWLHRRRIERVKHLAFGPRGAAARWTALAPAIRVFASVAASWGLLFLLSYDPVEVDKEPAKEASNHLLLLLDVSPSMQVEDAGAELPRISRARRAGEVVQGVLDRLDMERTRITLIAFYTDALPVLQDTFDKELIRNALDGLPMYTAFEPGTTNLGKGLSKGLEIARLWPADSATLLVVTDGDTDLASVPTMPRSIADTIVIGLGDPVRGSNVHGHNSRQDSLALKQLALRLGGQYHDGNRKHLPSELVGSLTMIAPRAGGEWSKRDLALFATITGCSALALIGTLLHTFGVAGWSATRSVSPHIRLVPQAKESAS